jgi:hypothetical protein
MAILLLTSMKKCEDEKERERRGAAQQEAVAALFREMRQLSSEESALAIECVEQRVYTVCFFLCFPFAVVGGERDREGVVVVTFGCMVGVL